MAILAIIFGVVMLSLAIRWALLNTQPDWALGWWPIKAAIVVAWLSITVGWFGLGYISVICLIRYFST